MALIKDIKVQELKGIGPYVVAGGYPPFYYPMMLIRIFDDEGNEGNCMGWLLHGPHIDEYLEGWKKQLIGKDPHYVEKFQQANSRKSVRYEMPYNHIDIALWDLLGKEHGTPVYKLLGADHDTMPGYVSTLCYETPEEYIKVAEDAFARGYTLYKIHGTGNVDLDIEVMRACRKAFPDKKLAIDPVNVYDRCESLRVGRVCDELNFEWLESPMDDFDIEGLKMLRQQIKTPLYVGETIEPPLRILPQYLSSGAFEAFRTLGDFTGGITSMHKQAILCEAHRVQFEPHSYGPTLIQAAHFNVMLAHNNCKWVEMPLPLDDWHIYMKTWIECDKDGIIHAPTEPGLGYELDEDAIADNIVREW